MNKNIESNIIYTPASESIHSIIIGDAISTTQTWFEVQFKASSIKYRYHILTKELTWFIDDIIATKGHYLFRKINKLVIAGIIFKISLY